VRGELRGRVVEIGVRLHQHRRRVAELERHLLPGGALAEAPPDVARAREGDHPHPVVLNEDVADRGRGADDDVQPPRRKAGLGLELGEEERREGRLARGLQDDGAPGGERGRHLVRDEVEREVEGADRTDDADGRPERERELACAGGGGVHRHDLAGEPPRDCGRGLERRHRALRLDARGLHRLARLGADRARELLVALGEELRDAREDVGAAVCRERLRERPLRGVDRAPCERLVGRRHARDDVARERRAHLLPLARVDPIAADEEPPLEGGHSHASI
jgi:hypothetical protein